MPEIKRTFAGAKMNKDLDERLVPNGEYRDAMNIQVRTTSGDSDGIGDAGTVQNIQGTRQILSKVLHSQPFVNDPNNKPTVVGSIADEKNNKAYFFVAGLRLDPVLESGNFGSETSGQPLVFIDTIVELEIKTGMGKPIVTPVVVDKWAVMRGKGGGVLQSTLESDTGDFGDYFSVQVGNSVADHLRIGMKMTAHNSSGSGADETLFSADIHNITNNDMPGISNTHKTIHFEKWPNLSQGFSQEMTSFGVPDYFLYKMPERVLNFDNTKKITGINIIDDLLFWTDGDGEPKRINIRKCKAGTYNYTTQTQLRLSSPSSPDQLISGTMNRHGSGGVWNLANNYNGLEPSLSPLINNDLKKEHVTVIRKAPKIPPTLEMSSSTRAGISSAYGVNKDFLGENSNFGAGTSISFSDTAMIGLKWQVNDVILFTEEISNVANRAKIRAIIDGYDPNSNDGNLSMTVISSSANYIPASTDVSNSGVWTIKLVDRKPLFELQMGRVGTRYRYDNGEYSTFGPWSELAFLPGKYDYNHKKGYNLGMVNTVRSLKIKDFIPHQKIRPLDVVAVDILWKTTESPNVYVIKTVERGKDEEWDKFVVGTPGDGVDNIDGVDWQGNFRFGFGELTVTSEMIHKVVEKNQLLRAWDNVPRFAQSQAIAANRIIYGNYTQGYNINKSFGLIQNLRSYADANEGAPKRSIKSMRNYKFGAVFGDKYGRETPVISSSFLDGDTAEGNMSMLAGDVSVDKEFSSMRNMFELKQVWDSGLTGTAPEDWMEYVKYYVKETSNEYYNIIMDRWYLAEDGNIWLSFSSADRNKIDDETYLHLKKSHATSDAITAKARYKVLAIKNEPPNFIKVDPRIMGTVKISSNDYPADDETGDFGVFEGGAVDTSTNTPTLLMDNTSLKLSNWSGFLDDYKPKGDLKIRIVGKNGEGHIKRGGQWRTITYHGVMEGGEGVIRWNKPFGSNANILAMFGADPDNTLSGANDLSYFIEFREDVVTTTQAEFDGKFFVKIERDDILESKVLNFANASGEYFNTRTWRLGYVDSRNENPTGSLQDDDDNELHPRNSYTWLNTSSVAASTSDTTNNSGSNVANITTLNSAWNNGEGAFTGSLTPQQSGGFLALGCEIDENNWGSAYNEDVNGVSTVNWTAYTRNFWKWAKDTESGPKKDIKTQMFIDSARTKYARLTGPQQPDPETTFYNVDYPDGSGNGRPLYYYVPTGLDGGYQSFAGEDEADNFSETVPGDLGRITISMQGNTGVWYADSDAAAFRSHMSQPGNKFRFNADPNGYIYQIVGVTDNLVAKNFSKNNFSIDSGLTTSYDEDGGLQDYQFDSGPTLENIIFGGQVGVDDGIDCGGGAFGTGDCDPTYDDYCGRQGFRVEFRKFDTESKQLASELDPGDKGIDPLEWDPRGTVCHDFREALLISAVEDSISDLAASSPTSNAACFETEPKEDIGLDLYYEASHAIPLYLNNNNAAQQFIPYHAKVTLREGSEPYASDMVKNFAAYQDHRVFYVGFSFTPPNPHVIVGIEARETVDDPYYPYVYDDSGVSPSFSSPKFFEFEHKNGMKTRTRILGQVHPVDENGKPFTIDPDADGDGVGGDWIYQYLDYYSEASATNSPGGNMVNYKELRFRPTIGVLERTGFFKVDANVFKYPVQLGWGNCYAFGNGVESDRIRDDFNAPQIDNGVKVSTSFLNYREEKKGSGLIYSGIYNSISGVNNLNEFNQAEKITKDLNPSYGAIQALRTRDTDVVVFTEDKVLKIITNKDALFNADGNAQLTATNRVLGTAIPFAGDYGISNNPESLAWDQFRMYFTDMQRGAVLRLSGNGITPISSVGMKSWFRDNLKKTDLLLGTFDTVNGEYNLTLNYKPSLGLENKTVSFNEASKGWVSFKSFIPEAGLSISGKYITGKQLSPKIPDGVIESQSSFTLWEHHVDIVDNVPESLTFGEIVNRNIFYAPTGFISNIPELAELSDYFTPSSIDVMFSDMPGVVKTFNTISYEGSQGFVSQFTTEQVTDSNGNVLSLTDKEYYNLTPQDGWRVSGIKTDKHENGVIREFKEKEGKWFNKISGGQRGDIKENHLNEFSVQGIGYLADTPVNTGTTVVETIDDGSIVPNEWNPTDQNEDCISVETSTSSVDNGDGTTTVTTTTTTTNSCDGTNSTLTSTSTVNTPTINETISITPEDDNSENWDSGVTWDD